MSKAIIPLKWDNDTLVLIDQRLLPNEEKFVNVTNINECHSAIKVMVVRGAPLIGITALWGMVIWCHNNPNGTLEQFIEAGEYLKTARPTAVNLEYEVDRCIAKAKEYYLQHSALGEFKKEIEAFAFEQMSNLHSMNHKMAELTYSQIQKTCGDKPLKLMTLCNTGVLACGPMGTALGVISYMASKGKVERVFASETRPYLQGSRLTSYELKSENIPHDVVVEGASSYLMQNKLVDAILIGADRIAANGDTANKIGSSSLSIVANYYQVPFFVVAPSSSFDTNLKSGFEIDIELRDPEEILSWRGERIAPLQVNALNPSFDITSNNNIASIVCEKGIIDPVNTENVLSVLQRV